jgi:hypothetical protein
MRVPRQRPQRRRTSVHGKSGRMVREGCCSYRLLFAEADCGFRRRAVTWHRRSLVDTHERDRANGVSSHPILGLIRRCTRETIVFRSRTLGQNAVQESPAMWTNTCRTRQLTGINRKSRYLPWKVPRISGAVRRPPSSRLRTGRHELFNVGEHFNRVPPQSHPPPRKRKP